MKSPLSAGLLLALALAPAAAPQESTAAIANPYDTPGDRVDGARLFLSQCASCHGQDARGGQGTPDLTTGTFKRASTDEGLIQILVKGIPGTTMPGFNFSGKQNWQLLAYLRSLIVARTNASLSGDPSAGRALFEANGCAKCHSGPSAPDLADSVRRLSAVELRRAILEPQAEVPESAWRLRATTSDGAVVEGLRLNEDTHTIQYLDGFGRLRSVVKSEARSVEIVRRSPMPEFRGKFSARQMDDLLTYLVQGGAR